MDAYYDPHAIKNNPFLVLHIFLLVRYIFTLNSLQLFVHWFVNNIFMNYTLHKIIGKNKIANT